MLFEGNWNQDKPNGYGEIRADYENQDMSSRISGNFKDGLYHGEISKIETKHGEIGNYKYTCVDGIPQQDKKSELSARFGGASLNLPDNLIMLDYNMIGENRTIWIYAFEGQRLGLWEFGDAT